MQGIGSAAVLTAVVLLGAVETSGQDREILTPCGIPFECVREQPIGNAVLSWKLSFNPRRPGIYDIVHWTVRQTGETDREFVAQLTVRVRGDRPVRMYRIHEHVRIRDWRRLWLTRRAVWREREEGSERYEQARLKLIRVFMMANALRGGANPMSLTY